MEVRQYFIPDFSNWKVLADGQSLQTATIDAFESAFARLKKELEVEGSKKPSCRSDEA